MAGGTGGMIGACLTCPLEVVKTRLQSKALSASHAGMLSIARGIAQADGVRGFWKGLGPMLVGVVPARAVYFATYDFAKGFLNARRPEGASTHLLSAMCAGAATNVMINPVWVSCAQIVTTLFVFASITAGQHIGILYLPGETVPWPRRRW